MTTSLYELATCEQFQIEEFEAIAADFARNILGLNPKECFISDESDLDDFSLMGASLDTGDLSWGQFVIARVFERYGVKLTTTRINLVTMFCMIERPQNKTLH